MILALGVWFEQGYTTSIGTVNKSPQELCDELIEKGGGKGCEPDEILVIKNDADCPSVIEHLIYGKDYCIS